jgi:N-acetylmuramoyl-L-alanine amidase
MPKKSTTKSKTPQAMSAPIFRVEGKMSTFGGPNDHGMSPTEGLALFDNADLTNPSFAYLFLPASPPGTSGLGRRLNPDERYLACRWDYTATSRSFLRANKALVQNPQNGRSAYAQPADWGPNTATGRVADLSPGLAAQLGLNTDDDVIVTISAAAPAVVSPTPAPRRRGHGSNNPHPKPKIKKFVASPNHSSRNGASIRMVVLHCTEASLDSTLKEFQNSSGRQVSAHYVIDRNGDIYQMVDDSERANHCRGANQNSIGIEHVGKETDTLTPAQAKASASMVRWLLQQYDIPRTSVYGHDFTPGYDQSHGGTSCPDKLFGAAHKQQTIADWVAANV